MKTVPSPLKSLLIALALTAVPALAQSGSGSAVTGAGTVNSVAKFSDTATVTSSSLTEVNGYVGIGTTAPNALLNLYGTLYAPPDGYNALRYDSLWGPISWGVTGNTANLWGTTFWSWQPDASNDGGNLAFATGNGPTVSPNSNIRMLIDRLGNVGIGTTSPGATLEVNGNVKLTSGSGASIIFPDGSSLTSANGLTSLTGGAGGNVGIGTTTSASPLTVGGGASIGSAYTGTPAPANGAIIQGSVGIGTATPNALLNINGPEYSSPDGYNSLRFDSAWGPISYGFTANTANQWGTTLWSWQPNASNIGGNLAFATGYGTTVSPNSNIRMLIDRLGNVGIGTSSPGATLEVNGNVKLTSGTSSSITFADGTSQTTAFNPANCGADYAESVDVTGDRTKYEPGDVLVLDPADPGKFLKSNQPYSTMVSGIYSTKPGFVGRLHPRNPITDAAEVPMAMVGRVPTKVSAENGPIKVGDLLVTSSTMGYAMKGTDRSQMLGSVVGKAMGSLDSGTGVIMVLVTLQ
jgi:hypothetical protein